MDTSEQYIKMCQKATEIQAMRPMPKEHETSAWQDGDWLWDGEGAIIVGGDCSWPEMYNGNLEITTAGHCEGDGYYPPVIIWLPRQDQLQEMMGWVKLILPNFSGWLEMVYGKDSSLITSWDQVWLAFYMHQCRSKRWNGEEWVKAAG